MDNSSNTERAKYRQICRQKLSEYLKQSLNIDIPPDQVRLQPKIYDSYRWQFDENIAHLFAKGLSKISVGVYKQLIDGIGQSFTASLIEASNYNRPYKELEEENSRLQEQVKCWQDVYTKEGKLRVAAEQEIETLKTRVKVQYEQQKKYESFLYMTAQAIRDQIESTQSEISPPEYLERVENTLL